MTCHDGHTLALLFLAGADTFYPKGAYSGVESLKELALLEGW